MFYIILYYTPRAARAPPLARVPGGGSRGGGAGARRVWCARCVWPRGATRTRGAGETGERNKNLYKRGPYTSPIVCVECEFVVCALWTLLLEFNTRHITVQILTSALI